MPKLGAGNPPFDSADILVPSRGYWARRVSGDVRSRASLPSRDFPIADEVASGALTQVDLKFLLCTQTMRIRQLLAAAFSVSFLLAQPIWASASEAGALPGQIVAKLDRTRLTLGGNMRLR